jgi:manganese efflux pump family protein
MSFADFLSLFLIALSLSADCFAVALGGAISLRSFRYVQVLRTSLAFGLAQAIMPVIGWAVGRTIVSFISSYDHWVAFGLLTVVGGRMLWEAFHEEDESQKRADFTRGITLLTLAIATSIDSLAVGLSFAFTDTSIIVASSIIGVVAFVITILGFFIGRKAGSLLGQRAKIIGGLILIGIGIKIVVTHLTGG